MIKIKLFIALLFACNLQHVAAQQKEHTIKSGVAAHFNWNMLPQHPRLFANDKGIVAIRLQEDKISNQLKFILKADAEKKLAAPKITYPNGVSNLETSREVEGRIISLALAYRVFDDKRFLVKAKEELLQLAAVNDWGLGHFLDVGEASLAAGIGFDWLYKDLTETERKTVAGAIKNKALLPSLNYKEGKGSWVNGNFNWNPVCHGGLMVGALAIAEMEPAITKQVVERAVKNIPIAGDAYSPDGAFAEGPSYWSYGTSFYVLVIEALRTAMGTSAGLQKIPGFLKTADYNIEMVGATGRAYNYSDYHYENLNEPVMLWFAKELNRAGLAKDELKDIKNLYELWQDGFTKNPDKQVNPNRFTPFELLWWNPALLKQNNVVKAPLQWTADGLMPVAIMRSAWNDPAAGFVAIKGGTPNNSHGHMDAGSFILEADGVRWAVDLGTEDYDKMRAAKLDLWNYTQTSSRWSTFRVGPEGHNILRFDNELQQVSGNGKIRQLKLQHGVMGNEADLSSLYVDKASKVTRTILLHPSGSFSIKDEWVAKERAVTYSFQWLTKAKVTKTKGGLLLQQDGQSLQLKIEQPFSMSGVAIEVEDVSQTKNIQDSPNPGLTRIVIKLKTAAMGKGRLFIRAIPGSIKQ